MSAFRRAHFLVLLLLFACSKKNALQPVAEEPFALLGHSVDGVVSSLVYREVSTTPTLRLVFSQPVDTVQIGQRIRLRNLANVYVPCRFALEGNDSVVMVTPLAPLNHLDKYYLTASTELSAQNRRKLAALGELIFYTKVDPTPKFPLISDDSLLTLVQRQTFRYFWDFGHPVSGLARERDSSGDMCTIGGSGFGIMAIVVAAERQFVGRSEAVARLRKITGFLKNTAQSFHGVFPHWLHGGTGVAMSFSALDDGADLVETSYLMQGLLCARQYFDGPDAEESALRAEINALYYAAEWDWFTRGGQNVLFWHWSQNHGWAMNFPVLGWNEALITYIMAACSPTHPIAKPVYEQGWARSGAMRNGKTFYGHVLPLGPDLGGPLFFEQYTFLGVSPVGLSDQYADYALQTRNHSLINYAYCKDNPKQFAGYSADCWGLTASDTYDGYTAHEPNNDRGVISPTAALSSMPFTPEESMRALRYFYYTLGDKIWREYGFVDAFSIHHAWYASSFLAIDQGPIIGMIENHRTGLLWDLFTSCPEVKVGMTNLGFSAPYLP
jgi:hypothetical protein